MRLLSAVFVGLVAAVTLFAVAVSASRSTGFDLVESLGAFSCAAGPEYCIDLKADNHWPDLKPKLIKTMLKFAHDMVHPSSPRHLYIRSLLPQEAQALFKTAKKMHVAPADRSALATHKASARAVTEALRKTTKVGGSSASDDKYAIFGFLPQFGGDALVNGAAATFDTNCFGGVTVTATSSGDNVTVTTQGAHNGFLCSDWILLVAGGTSSHIQFINNDNPITWTFSTADYLPENKWYLARHGVRALKFPKGFLQSLGQILETVEMLAGFAELPLTNITLERNIHFLHDYTEVSPRMQPKTQYRNGGSTVGNAIHHLIQSGDGFIVYRPDGLDTMLGWADGATSGHSTMAMRDSSGALHVCESTTKDAYWPIGNGVECHPYLEWIAAVERAQMSALWNPLAPEYRAKFNVQKGWDYINAHLGVNYGFPTLLMPYVDTVKDNFPCLPPDYKTCLEPETFEQVALMLDRIMADANTNLFRQAFNHRTRTPATTSVLAGFMHAATAKGMSFSDIYTMPEQDSWRYNMTLNNGSTTMSASSVCDVLVCRVWKHGGLFGDLDFNCGELDIYNNWMIAIFDSLKQGEGRPEICKTTDPNNMHCQLTGILTLHFRPDQNSIKPYPHMGEKCPSLAPDYIRPLGC